MSGAFTTSRQGGDVGFSVSAPHGFLSRLSIAQSSYEDCARQNAFPDKRRLAVYAGREEFNSDVTSVDQRNSRRKVDEFAHFPSPGMVNRISVLSITLQFFKIQSLAQTLCATAQTVDKLSHGAGRVIHKHVAGKPSLSRRAELAASGPSPASMNAGRGL